MRHGESLWNRKGLFTGCVDVPLSDVGVDEARMAGRRIADVPVDCIFVSDLVRAQMTALIAMTQHRLGKVPVVVHDEAKVQLSPKIWSAETESDTIPVHRAWQLNERMYGELQGLDKQDTFEKYGVEQVNAWRRSYDVPPPAGESLEMTAKRAVAFFTSEITPRLASGESVLVSAHGNSLRAIIMHIEGLTPEEVTLLELFTGIPLVYEYDAEGHGDSSGDHAFDSKLRRLGTPQSDNQPGVYAISRDLAVYKDKSSTLEPHYSS